jgi:hypothetical protein
VCVSHLRLYVRVGVRRKAGNNYRMTAHRLMDTSTHKKKQTDGFLSMLLYTYRELPRPQQWTFSYTIRTCYSIIIERDGSSWFSVLDKYI